MSSNGVDERVNQILSPILFVSTCIVFFVTWPLIYNISDNIINGPCSGMGNWSTWSGCSNLCDGNGFMSRNRNISDSETCKATLVQKKYCQTTLCPTACGSAFSTFTDCLDESSSLSTCKSTDDPSSSYSVETYPTQATSGNIRCISSLEITQCRITPPACVGTSEQLELEGSAALQKRLAMVMKIMKGSRLIWTLEDWLQDTVNRILPVSPSNMLRWDSRVENDQQFDILLRLTIDISPTDNLFIPADYYTTFRQVSDLTRTQKSLYSLIRALETDICIALLYASQSSGCISWIIPRVDSDALDVYFPLVSSANISSIDKDGIFKDTYFPLSTNYTQLIQMKNDLQLKGVQGWGREGGRRGERRDDALRLYHRVFQAISSLNAKEGVLQVATPLDKDFAGFLRAFIKGFDQIGSGLDAVQPTRGGWVKESQFIYVDNSIQEDDMDRVYKSLLSDKWRLVTSNKTYFPPTMDTVCVLKETALVPPLFRANSTVLSQKGSLKRWSLEDMAADLTVGNSFEPWEWCMGKCEEYNCECWQVNLFPGNQSSINSTNNDTTIVTESEFFCEVLTGPVTGLESRDGWSSSLRRNLSAGSQACIVGSQVGDPEYTVSQVSWTADKNDALCSSLCGWGFFYVSYPLLDDSVDPTIDLVIQSTGTQQYSWWERAEYTAAFSWLDQIRARPIQLFESRLMCPLSSMPVPCRVVGATADQKAICGERDPLWQGCRDDGGWSDWTDCEPCGLPTDKSRNFETQVKDGLGLPLGVSPGDMTSKRSRTCGVSPPLENLYGRGSLIPSGFHKWQVLDNFCVQQEFCLEPCGAVGLALGRNHTCVLHDLGQVVCFGDNSQLQLGIGVADGGARGGGQLVDGSDGLWEGGEVLMDSGWLRTPDLLASATSTTLSSTSPRMSLNLDYPIRLEGGEWSTCAIMLMGGVTCWGGGKSPWKVNIPGGERAGGPLAISGSGDVCVGLESGSAFCSGDAGVGILEFSLVSSTNSSQLACDLVQMDGGPGGFCGVVACVDGTRQVRCWGEEWAPKNESSVVNVASNAFRGVHVGQSEACTWWGDTTSSIACWQIGSTLVSRLNTVPNTVILDFADDPLAENQHMVIAFNTSKSLSAKTTLSSVSVRTIPISANNVIISTSSIFSIPLGFSPLQPPSRTLRTATGDIFAFEGCTSSIYSFIAFPNHQCRLESRTPSGWNMTSDFTDTTKSELLTMDSWCECDVIDNSMMLLGDAYGGMLSRRGVESDMRSQCFLFQSDGKVAQRINVGSISRILYLSYSWLSVREGEETRWVRSGGAEVGGKGADLGDVKCVRKSSVDVPRTLIRSSSKWWSDDVEKAHACMIVYNAKAAPRPGVVDSPRWQVPQKIVSNVNNWLSGVEGSGWEEGMPITFRYPTGGQVICWGSDNPSRLGRVLGSKSAESIQFRMTLSEELMLMKD